MLIHIKTVVFVFAWGFFFAFKMKTSVKLLY